MSLIKNLISYSEEVPLSKSRKTLWNSFLSKGFPTNKHEDWKYTSIKKIISKNYVLKNAAKNEEAIDFKKYGLGLKNQIIILDGSLKKHPKLDGLSISSFSEFDCRNDNSLIELNAALSNDGFCLSLMKNTIIQDPVEIIFINSNKNNFLQYRNQIKIGENSEIKLVEQIYDLSDSETLYNNFTRISCGNNSKIEYNKIQNNSSKSNVIDSMNVFQNKDSTATVNTLIFGGNFIRNNLNFEQNGENCESNMNGVSLIDNNQLADNHTFVDHKIANCRSNEMYKGIYLGKSKGVFNGKIMVRKDAQKIDAFQANNNLLLSEDSTIDSKPQLEIYADDVKCSHGCTIGQLDKDSLFYMRSRGIGIEESKAILTYAFASEAINNLSIKEVKKLCKDLLSRKLNVNLDLSI